MANSSDQINPQDHPTLHALKEVLGFRLGYKEERGFWLSSPTTPELMELEATIKERIPNLISQLQTLQTRPAAQAQTSSAVAPAAPAPSLKIVPAEDNENEEIKLDIFTDGKGHYHLSTEDLTKMTDLIWICHYLESKLYKMHQVMGLPNNPYKCSNFKDTSIYRTLCDRAEQDVDMEHGGITSAISARFKRRLPKPYNDIVKAHLQLFKKFEAWKANGKYTTLTVEGAPNDATPDAIREDLKIGNWLVTDVGYPSKNGGKWVILIEKSKSELIAQLVRKNSIYAKVKGCNVTIREIKGIGQAPTSR